MWLSERLSHLPWVKASMWQTDLNSGGSSSQADLLSTSRSVLKLKTEFSSYMVFTKAEEGKRDFPAEQSYPVWTNNPSMTKSYLTFQSSFASPFYVPFTKTLQVKFWSLPTSHYHLSLGPGLLISLAHLELGQGHFSDLLPVIHYGDCDPLGSSNKNWKVVMYHTFDFIVLFDELFLVTSRVTGLGSWLERGRTQAMSLLQFHSRNY